MASKRPKERCTVCGVITASVILNTSIPICKNIVCYHTFIDEVNQQLRELAKEPWRGINVKND